MADDIARGPHLTSFLGQVDALSAWLLHCLSSAGITGATAKRAGTRLSELAGEVEEVHNLITRAEPLEGVRLSLPLDYEAFDASQIFPADLAKRADAGIQDLACGVQDDLAQIARERKKQLQTQLGKDAKQSRASMKLWFAMNACDCIEEIGATALRLGEAARYLFQEQFIVVLSNTPDKE